MTIPVDQSLSCVVQASSVDSPQTKPMIYYSYNQIHAAVASAVPKLVASNFHEPDYLLAISGGGLIPARILRTFLRKSSGNSSVASIKVIGLELYRDGTASMREDGIVRTQWLNYQADMLDGFLGKKILIVDEVDDTRTTLSYAAKELLRDIDAQHKLHPEQSSNTQLGVFVLHNKLKPKLGQVPDGIPYFAAMDVQGNSWIKYPWDAVDIEHHTAQSAVQKI